MANTKVSALTSIPAMDRATGVCETCGNEYKTYPSWSKVRRTCSRKCMGVLKSVENSGSNHPMFGKHHSEKTKALLSIQSKGLSKNIGADNPMYGKKSWNSGKKTGIVPKTAFKRGQASWNKGKEYKAIKGSNHYNWKGGVTSLNEKIRKSLEYREWRKAVFERDNYTCQNCGKRGGWLEADHIKQFAYYPNLRFAISNGRTLCKPCHRNTETWGNQYRDVAGRFSRPIGVKHG